VVMPKLGNTVESCIIVKWNVSEGQTVKADTVLCEIETDKATMDVPAGAEGTLLKRLRNEGDDVPVLEAIALIGAAGEKVDATVLGGAGQSAPASPAAPDSSAARGPSAMPAAAEPSLAPAGQSGSAAGSASPRARALAREESLPLSLFAEGSGPGGRIIERDVRAALASSHGMTAAAKESAAKNGALSDLAVLRGLYEAATSGGSGLGGRVTLADLAAAKAAGPAATPATAAAATPAGGSAPSAAAPDSAFPGPSTDTPIKSIRKIIADRMTHSLQTSAQITLNTSAPADRLLVLRNRFKNSEPSRGFTGITIGDMVAFAAVQVLEKYPKLNAHVVDGVMRSFARVHLGLAVDTPRGLMVPVLRDARALSLRQFSEQSKLLARSCIDGSPNPDLLSGSTFTVTNLGAFGIESFTPILNEPETAILGVDCVTPRAVAGPDGKPAIEMRIGFSLTVDHRVVDGADGARYLKDLVDYIANIDIVMLA
ncbi:MAG: dihydrolipoamide acetyltransferase family protein, partial [Spirochaetales bacterium]